MSGIFKFNQNHDERGRFTTGPGGSANPWKVAEVGRDVLVADVGRRMAEAGVSPEEAYGIAANYEPDGSGYAAERVKQVDNMKSMLESPYFAEKGRQFTYINGNGQMGSDFPRDGLPRTILNGQSTEAEIGAAFDEAVMVGAAGRLDEMWRARANYDTSISVQDAAKRMTGHGIDLATYTGSADMAAMLTSKEGGFTGRLSDRAADAYTKAVYDQTQSWLKANGVTEVKVYRGLRAHAPGDTFPEGDVSFKQRPLSSWTAQRSTSTQFNREPFSGTAAGYRLERDVPAKDIWSIAERGGPAVIGEMEVIVLSDGTDMTRVSRVDADGYLPGEIPSEVKADWIPRVFPIEKFNPYHDDLGRFTTRYGGGGGGVRPFEDGNEGIIEHIDAIEDQVADRLSKKPRPAEPTAHVEVPQYQLAAKVNVSMGPYGMSQITPQDGASTSAQLSDAFEAISATHGLPDDIDLRINLMDKPEMDAAGFDDSTDGVYHPGHPGNLFIRAGSDTTRSTFVHEFGHLIDFEVLDGDRTGVFDAMRKADSTFEVEKRFPDAQQRENLLKYLNNEKEMFARGYTQWVATRSGDFNILLDTYAEAGLGHWRPDDFEPIAAEFDKLFKDSGLAKENVTKYSASQPRDERGRWTSVGATDVDWATAVEVAPGSIDAAEAAKLAEADVPLEGLDFETLPQDDVGMLDAQFAEATNSVVDMPGSPSYLGVNVLENPSAIDPGLRKGFEGVYANQTYGHGGLKTEMTDFELHTWGIYVKGSVLYPDGSRAGTFARTFNVGEGTVSHDELFLDDAAQGTGFATDFYNKSEVLYARLGLTDINIHAVSVGAYAWAKAGFEWSYPPADLSYNLRDVLDMHSDISPADREWMSEALAEFTAWENGELEFVPEYPTYMFANATTSSGEPLGKELLIGLDWEGSRPVTSYADLQTFAKSKSGDYARLFTAFIRSRGIDMDDRFWSAADHEAWAVVYAQFRDGNMILKFNPNHDERGRFATSGGGSAATETLFAVSGESDAASEVFREVNAANVASDIYDTVGEDDIESAAQIVAFEDGLNGYGSAPPTADVMAEYFTPGGDRATQTKALYAKAVARLQEQWGSATNSGLGLNMQMSTEDALVRNDSLPLDALPDTLSGGEWGEDSSVYFNAPSDFIDSWARAQYDRTQKYLASKGITEVTVHRGFQMTDEMFNEHYGEYGPTIMQTRPLSATTLDYNEAVGFADHGDMFWGGFGEDEEGNPIPYKGYVASGTVKAEDIFSADGGVGWGSLKEVVILGGYHDVDLHVVNSKGDIVKSAPRAARGDVARIGRFVVETGVAPGKRRVRKFNPNHDPNTGRFTSGPGGAKLSVDTTGLDATESHADFLGLKTQRAEAAIAKATGGAELPPAKVKWITGEDMTERMGNEKVRGYYDSRSPGELHVSDTQGSQFFLVHEYGHLYDFERMGAGTGIFSTNNPGSPAWDVVQTMRQTPEYKEWTYGPDATYWGSNSEMFARAFTQYVANKSGDEVLLQNLGEQGGAQWSPENFEPVSRSLDKMFATMRERDEFNRNYDNLIAQEMDRLRREKE